MQILHKGFFKQSELILPPCEIPVGKSLANLKSLLWKRTIGGQDADVIGEEEEAAGIREIWINKRSGKDRST